MRDHRTLKTERLLPFSAEAIYGAFASGRMLASWWGPEGFTNTFHAFEFIEGGSWIFTMHGPDGRDYGNQSRFQALVPARRVVIRHERPPLFTLTIGLTPLKDCTHLTWEQTFDDAETARALTARVVSANEENLDRLTAALSQVHRASAPLSPRN